MVGTDHIRAVRRSVVLAFYLLGGLAMTLPGCSKLTPPGSAPPPATTQRAEPQGDADPAGQITLRHLGTIKLQADDPPPSPIRDIVDFDIDDRGRIGFYRAATIESAWFVLVGATGEVLREIPFADGKLTSITLPMIRWAGGERWLAFGHDESRNEKTFVWSIDSQAGALGLPAEISRPRPDSIAGDRRGGFVVYRTITTPTVDGINLFRFGEILAFDSSGRERWRFTGSEDHRDRSLPFAASITVTTDGTIVLLDQNDHNLSFFSLDGEFLGTAQSGLMHSCIPHDTQAFADRDGGLIVYNQFTQGPVRRLAPPDVVREPPAEGAAETLWPFTRFQRPFPGEISRPVRPHLADGRPLGMWAGARCDPDGHLWTCDGETFYRLDDTGVVDRIVGDNQFDGRLRSIGGHTVGLDGRIYLANARTGDIHVFDAQGRLIHVLRPGPTEFPEAGSLALGPDGSVYERLHDAQFLEFSADGARRGVRDLGPRAAEGKTLFQPDGERLWLVQDQRIYLANTSGGKLLQTISQRPDGSEIRRIYGSAAGPDGALAYISGPSTEVRGGNHAINLCSSEGLPIRTVELPIEYVSDPTFDGRHVVFRSLLPCEDLWGYDVQSDTLKRIRGPAVSAKPPGGSPFFSVGGRELWLVDPAGRKVERYAIPEDPVRPRE